MNRCGHLIVAILAVVVASCHRDAGPADPRQTQCDALCRQKWGKALRDLPTVQLIVLSAHNENILDEFEEAFSLYHAVRFGQRVQFDRRNVGGGGSRIQQYLLNVYRATDKAGRGGNPEIDVLWGGGEFPYMDLVRGLPNRGPLLQKLTLAPEVLANIPAEYAGTPLYDRDLRWVGSALSGFGILYNKGMLSRCRIAPPRDWQDLGDARFANLLELADPSQSGSAAAAYRTIAISSPDWPQGWARLMMMLSNARKMDASSGAVADAPPFGEALVVTCIDFYGTMRAMEAPDQLEYFTPAGQSVFTPDPIGILQGAPHPELAQQFVRFVMSTQGQSLWALPAGAEGGPVRCALGRQPIRRDVYQTCAGKMLPYIVNPYAKGQLSTLPADARKIDYAVLRELVFAAAVADHDGLVLRPPRRRRKPRPPTSAPIPLAASQRRHPRRHVRHRQGPQGQVSPRPTAKRMGRVLPREIRGDGAEPPVVWN